MSIPFPLDRDFLISRALARSVDYHEAERNRELKSIPARCEVKCSPIYGALEEDRIWRACHRTNFHHVRMYAYLDLLGEYK